MLDETKELDISLLDQIVTIAFDSKHAQRSAANTFLVKMKEDPNMWKRAGAILESSQLEATKFFGLQVLGDAVNTRWKIIPDDQREGIKNYVVGKVMGLSSSPQLLQQNSTFVGRLNLVLVNILKQDWPHNWPTFIGDLVDASKTSESLCENNMQILQILSEEVFDFSIDSMTSAKAKHMKESLNEEFSKVFELCQFILEASEQPSLIIATLKTLQCFLSWIPLGYIFETQLIPTLISKFFPLPMFRTYTIDCLTEIASLPPGDINTEYLPSIQQLLCMILTQLGEIIPMDTNLVAAYDNGDEESCLFVSRLALFLSTFLKSFGNLFENTSNVEHQQAIVNALTYLVMISEVNDEEQDGEVFKSCLEFWYHFAKDLFTSDDYKRNSNANALDNFSAWGDRGGLNPSSAQSSRRVAAYAEILHRLRIVIIDKMAKPEEVIIVEDDDGNIVREMTKDTEVIAQYKTMRETIIYLTHLNYEDTEAIMLVKLELQIDGGEFTWNGLNTLCWAIGSISGAMSEMDEKRFLVTVIKDLLRLCEEQRGKDNKAVVASNIMYIVGQYPRFLRAHWKFLKTVVNKLFEFMHEPHPGVQDMACDTFLKIAQKCKRKFMTIQTDETQPFILTLIGELHRHIGDLQPHQVQAFYEAVATMLSDKGQAIQLSREDTVVNLMTLPNGSFQDILAQGNKDMAAMFQLDTVKELQKIFRTNTRVCGAVGSIFIHQMSNIFVDMLNVYRLYSDHILEACQQQGEVATRYTLYKAMRGVKSEILDLLTAFFENINDLDNGRDIMMTTFVPHICQEVLTDYQKTVPSARDSRVLKLFGTAISFLRDHVSSQVPQIMDAIFEPTLEMITKNMMDYPEHRLAFFSFLRQANTHCFFGLFSIPPQQQKLVVDSVVWAFKHTERNISETGLEILYELLQNVNQSMDVSQPFYQQFLLPLIQDIIGIMTDRLHKSGFKQQATVLQLMFQILETDKVLVAVEDSASGLSAPAAADGSVDNKTFVKEYVGNLLLTSFPNLSRDQIITFVIGLFEISQDLQAFKQHLRDFLIAVKEFANEDNSELFTEEAEANLELQRQQQMQYKASIPGLLTPQEIYDEDPDL